MGLLLLDNFFFSTESAHTLLVLLFLFEIQQSKVGTNAITSPTFFYIRRPLGFVIIWV